MLPWVAQLQCMQEVGTAGPKRDVVKMAREFELEVIVLGMVSGQLQMQPECTTQGTPE